MKQQDLFGRPSPLKPTPAPSQEAPAAAVSPSPTRPAWRRPAPEARPQAPGPLTVSELTARIKERLEPEFLRVVVRGEVTGFRGPNARGHLYFSIKDAAAAIEVRVWQSTARGLRFALRDGLAVVVEGSLNVYEPSGRYSLIAQRLEPAGVGEKAAQFELLKARLAQEGLIGPRRTRPKRSLPFLPRRIGVVTSVSGAALRDFLKVLHRRHPRLSVLLADARVQGEGAAYEVSRALRALARTDVDVIVVTRGGGSADDLGAFNEEPVVRAIFDSPVPVVSAVGHEIDTTLADLVADVRAPTPSAAAEALAPVLAELELQLAGLKARLVRAAEKVLFVRQSQLRALRGALVDPRRALAEARLRLDDRADRIAGALHRRVRDERAALRATAVKLQQLRPQAQLRRRREQLDALEARLVSVGRRRPAELRAALARLSLGLERASPRPVLARLRQGLGHEARRLRSGLGRSLLVERQRVATLGGRLDALSPLKVLGRGYAIAQRPDGAVVRRAGEVGVGDELRLRLAEGDELFAAVTQVKPGSK